MNRLPPEDRKDTEQHLSACLVSIPRGYDNPGTIDLGNCPIVVEDADSANDAANWVSERIMEHMTKLGIPYNEARKVAENFKRQQLKEMADSFNRTNDQKRADKPRFDLN